MSEHIRFHFDPVCPWAWQSSKWIRDVEATRDVEVDWRLFSLQMINSDKDDPLADAHARGTSALRTLALVRLKDGNEAVGRLYEALGRRVHEGAEELGVPTIKNALADVGLDESLVDDALEDESTADFVKGDHRAAVDEVGAFGVPTIVFESGKGIFGPVISSPPARDDAGELFEHVRWLAEHERFFELKRTRDRRPGQ